MVVFLGGCGGLASLVTTAANTSLGGMEAWVFMPDAGAKHASKHISKVTPPSGFVALPGATLTIVGTGLSAVTDSSGYASITGLASGTYQVTVGKEGYKTFTYTVTVSTGTDTQVGGGSGMQTYLSTDPGIMDLSAASGVTGASITITGVSFGSTQGTSTVEFNGMAATDITSWFSTSIVCKVPITATTGNIVVTVGGVASNGINFTVTGPGRANIDRLTPASGLPDASITISGSGFGATQGTSTVTFNGLEAETSTWGPTSIICKVPIEATTGDVVVTVDGVASNGVNFTVTNGEPKIDILDPSIGAIGNTVTIYGSGFGLTQGTSTVEFNGIAATIDSWDKYTIVCKVPTGASTENVVVKVNSLSSTGVTFTVTGGWTPGVSRLIDKLLLFCLR